MWRRCDEDSVLWLLNAAAGIGGDRKWALSVLRRRRRTVQWRSEQNDRRGGKRVPRTEEDASSVEMRRSKTVRQQTRFWPRPPTGAANFVAWNYRVLFMIGICLKFCYLSGRRDRSMFVMAAHIQWECPSSSARTEWSKWIRMEHRAHLIEHSCANPDESPRIFRPITYWDYSHRRRTTTVLHTTPTHVFPNHFHHPYSPILPQTFGCSNPPNSRANEFIIRSALGSFCIHLVQDLNVRRSELGEICAQCYSTNHQSDAPSLCYPP